MRKKEFEAAKPIKSILKLLLILCNCAAHLKDRTYSCPPITPRDYKFPDMEYCPLAYEWQEVLEGKSCGFRSWYPRSSNPTKSFGKTLSMTKVATWPEFPAPIFILNAWYWRFSMVRQRPERFHRYLWRASEGVIFRKPHGWKFSFEVWQCNESVKIFTKFLW